MKSIAEPTAASKDVEALERLDRGQGGGRRPAQDDVDDNYYEDIHVGHVTIMLMATCSKSCLRRPPQPCTRERMSWTGRRSSGR